MSTAVPLTGVADLGGVGGVRVQIPHPDRQSRLLLLFRGFLMIPHWFFAIAVVIVAMVASILSYFACLFTGRPACVGFLSGVLRYLVRLQAYSWFLTDAYPPFSLSEGSYPISVLVDEPGRIGRWRFFFTYLLLIPQFVAFYVLFIVAGIGSFIAWFAVLITGRYPTALFNLATAAVRYQTRINAYMYLLTAHYPPFSLA